MKTCSFPKQKSTNLEIFNTDFIQNIKYKWKKVWYLILTLTILYWINLIFFTLAIFDYNNNRKPFCGVLITITNLLTLYEIIGTISVGSIYWKNVLNYFDLIIYSSPLLWGDTVINGDFNPIDYDNFVATWFLAIASAFRGITYFRTFDATRFYIRMITEAIYDTYVFFIILLYSTLCFGIIYYISQPDDIDGLSSIGKSLFISYNLDLGGFESPMTSLGYITFLAQAFINLIVLVNLLITILGSSYSNFEETSHIYNFKEMLDITIEIKCIMHWGNKNEVKYYMHSCVKSDMKVVEKEQIINTIKETQKEQMLTLKKFEDTILEELKKMRSDIGNIYSNQMRNEVR